MADPGDWHQPEGCPWQIHTTVGVYFWTGAEGRATEEPTVLVWFKGPGWPDEDDIVIGEAHTFAQAKQQAERHLACVVEGAIVPVPFRDWSTKDG